jgi:hypothetical protein
VAAKGLKDVALFGLVAFTVAVFGLGALVVGLLMALAPIVTAWGATAIVAGGLFMISIVLVLLARSRWAKTIAAISDDGGVRP